MTHHAVVEREAWLTARRDLLEKEKAFTRERDELSRLRRALPWVRVDRPYVFDTADGPQTLARLFSGASQLIVYHFMYGTDWNEPCKSCSFWADNFNGIDVHLRHRDVTLLAVSRAPLAKIEAVRRRMGWQFQWVSSGACDFNRDYQVSFAPEERAAGPVYYNYEMRPFPADEAPGISVFYRNERNEVFHTYSCYARGLDMLNGAYHYLDLAPKGRDEDGQPYTMAWLRHRDRYEA